MSPVRCEDCFWARWEGWERISCQLKGAEENPASLRLCPDFRPRLPKELLEGMEEMLHRVVKGQSEREEGERGGWKVMVERTQGGYAVYLRPRLEEREIRKLAEKGERVGRG
ncbi:MAG: hypothetical protein QXF20_01550 [Candidatus Hadarchaeales archaeon]